MILSRRITILVVVLATVAFVGLAWLQIKNLQSSIDTNRQIFRQKVGVVSSYVATTFSLDKDYPYLLHDTEHKLRRTGQRSDPQMDRIMRDLIDPALTENGIDIPYEYAIYTHNGRGDGFRFVMGDDGSGLDFELENCEDPNERSHGWANLTCSRGSHVQNYHLAIFFPNREEYVFAQSSGALVMAISFIFLLMGCFAYTLFVIQRQKRLSTIKNDFINNLTHEFKTPIASISLAAKMLKSTRTEKTKDANYLEIIEQEGKRLEGQVDKVLQLAMMDSGNFSLNKKTLDVHEVIRNVVDSMSLTVSKKDGIIETNLNAGKATVVADETHLTNIIYNLVDNALKYTVDAPRITITTHDEAEGVAISIRDNGLGIGAEVQRFIFDNFYRAESGNIHNVKGFGLGLSYVKKIIDAHKGQINLKSQLNKGTEFNVFLPFSV